MPSDFTSRFQTIGVMTNARNNTSLDSACRSRVTICPERSTVIPERALFRNLGGRGLEGKFPPIGKTPQPRNLKHRNRERMTNSRTPHQLRVALRDSLKNSKIATATSYASQSSSTWARLSSIFQNAFRRSRHYSKTSRQFSLYRPQHLDACSVAGTELTLACWSGWSHALSPANGLPKNFLVSVSAA